MGIAAMEELRRALVDTAAAGVDFAGEDFRLRERGEQLAQLAAKVPVIKTVCGQLAKLQEEDEGRAATLLELYNLVHAVCVAQADAAESGQPVEIFGNEEAVHIPTLHYADIRGVKDALTGSGSGRLEVVQDAERQGWLEDHRLSRAMVTGIRGSYYEVADFCANYVRKKGAAMAPALRAEFNPQGGRGDVRMLEVLSQISGGAENALYLELAESAKGDMLAAAVRALGRDKENEAYLIERAQNNKRGKHWYLAALQAMSSRSAQQFAWDSLNAANYDAYREAISEKLPDEACAFFAEQLIALVNGLPDKCEMEDTDECRKLSLLMNFIYYQTSPVLIPALRAVVEQRKKLSRSELKYQGSKVFLLENFAKKLAFFNDPEQNAYLIGLHADMEPDLLVPVFVAYCNSYKGVGLYDEFTKELKKNASATEISQILKYAVLYRDNPTEHGEMYYHAMHTYPLGEEVKKDKRWLSFYISRADVPMVLKLCERGDKVEKFFDDFYKANKDRYSACTWSMAAKLLDIASPHAEEFILRAVSEAQTHDALGTKYQDVLLRLGRDCREKLRRAAEAAAGSKTSRYYNRQEFTDFVRSCAETI